MSKAVNAVIVGLTVFILLTGSIWYVTVARGPSRVSAAEVEQGWESINETTAVIWAQVTFRNPYDFRIDLTSFAYEFWVNDRRWSQNNSTDEVRLPPRGEATLPARIVLNTTDMDEWFDQHIANGERTEVLFTGNATFQVGGGELAVPFERRQNWETQLRRTLEELRNCPQDEPAPCIADASVKWVLEDQSSVLQLVLTIRNNNLDEMTITNRTATLALGGVPIATAEATDAVSIARQEGRFFEFPMAVDRAKIVDWWIHHVQVCEVSEAALDVVLDYEVKAQTFPPEPTLPTSTTPSITTPTTTPTSTTTTAPPTTPPPTTPPPTTPPPTTPPPTTPPPTTPPPTTTAPPPNNAPTAAYTFSTTNLTVNADGAGSTDPDGDTLSFTWDWGDGSTPGTGNPASHTYAAAGTYTVILTVDDGAGGTDTDSQSVTVTDPPPPTTTTEPPPPTTGNTTPPVDTNQTSQPASGQPSGGGSDAPPQTFLVGFRKALWYPLQATALQLGLLETESQTQARPTTNGVERIAWDLELAEFRTGFACALES